MMKLISDKDGVDIIISPVTGNDGIEVNLDFNFALKQLHDLDTLHKDWVLKLIDKGELVGYADFSAFQFLADGVERRTIALRSITVEPRHRGQGKSYDVMKLVLDTVATYCDTTWGKVETGPVVFVEKRHMSHLPEADRIGFFEFLKKVGEKLLGCDSYKQPTGGDLSVSVVGDQLSMQLIEGHLLRSNSVEVRD